MIDAAPVPSIQPIIEARGHTVIHRNETREGLTTCRTPWPATQCACGYFRLQWALMPEEIALARKEPRDD
jgi:hypothetical protein